MEVPASLGMTMLNAVERAKRAQRRAKRNVQIKIPDTGLGRRQDSAASTLHAKKRARSKAKGAQQDTIDGSTQQHYGLN
jgi:hypothetical protein